MKQCPQCGQTYSDTEINFCLNDGELLRYSVADDTPKTIFQNDPAAFDDSPPTAVLNKPRVTQSDWPPQATPVQWQGQQNYPQQQFGHYSMTVSPNQTLAAVSLGLGIGSLTIGWCCSLGLLLSPAALITGFIALAQIKKDPCANSGRGFAMGGIVTAAIFLACYILFIIIYGMAAIISGIS